jgi:phosphotransferase system HPr (HPr) family protein
LTTTANRTVRVTNPQGLHLRPCSAIVDLVRRHRAEVTVRKGSQSVNAASVLDLLSLDAPSGTELVLFATGADADEALDALANLFRGEFEMVYAQ